jgi:hypothetical protein
MRWLALLALVACKPKDPGPDAEAGKPIVVYFTADTLGLHAAKEAGYCESISAAAASHGLDAACLDGAIAPSSWTGESHTRTLFPQHLAGNLRSQKTPACEPAPAPFLDVIADAYDGQYVIGADNPVFGTVKNVECDDGRIGWHRGADAIYAARSGGEANAEVPEEDRMLHAGIDVFLDRVGEGAAVTAFFNALEVGGHFPRCWHDPQTEACQGLWSIALDAGIVTAQDDPKEKFLDRQFEDALLTHISDAWPGREAELRPLFWTSMHESIAHHKGPLFDDRLERILAGVEAAGRNEDLTLVVLGDHGENPCVERPFSGGLSCKHGSITTEWTGIVPVYTIPASRAADWQAKGLVGDADTPWSSANVTWGLMDAAGVAIPDDWPAMEPVGQATSWACLVNAENGGEPKGIRVLGDVSVRCEGSSCGAWTWAEPTDVSYFPEPLAEIPAGLQDFADGWVVGACSG